MRKQSAKNATKNEAQNLAMRIELAAEATTKTFLANPFTIDTIAPPPGLYKPGELVQVGRMPVGRVERVLADARVLIVSSPEAPTKENPNPAQDEESRTVFSCPSFKARKYLYEEPKTNFLREHVKLYYSQRFVSDLLFKVVDFGVDFNPPYQRGMVWDIEDKQLLIDSIFRGADIGKFVFLTREHETKKNADGQQETLPLYEILDGKQRLSALIEFVYDGFTYNGLRFSQMSESDRRFITNYSVNIAEIPKESMSEADILRLFIRLNTAGKPQDPDHLKKLQAELEKIEDGLNLAGAMGTADGRKTTKP
jgi:hypothetical protein